MKRHLINLLRELGVTLDALLGGDHRRYGHQPPSKDLTLRAPWSEEEREHINRLWSKASEQIYKRPNPVLAHSNENWVLVERYVTTFNPPNFLLVFKRGETVLEMTVPQDVWYAFDGLKLPNVSPPPKINPIIKTRLEQVVRNYLKDPSDINLTALNTVLDTMEG
jgi:hypothetical protein